MSTFPSMSKTHPMDAFGAFLHNSMADEFLPKIMKQAKYAMMMKIDDETFNIYDELEKLLVDFKETNRVALEEHGLTYFLNKLKDKIAAEPSNIGLVIYCLNIIDLDYISDNQTKVLGEKPGARQVIVIDSEKISDKILTKYTTGNRKEITITVKSICRALIKDIYKYDTENGIKEITELCLKMFEKEYKN